jgi:hypothetical protein
MCLSRVDPPRLERADHGGVLSAGLGADHDLGRFRAGDHQLAGDLSHQRAVGQRAGLPGGALRHGSCLHTGRPRLQAPAGGDQVTKYVVGQVAQQVCVRACGLGHHPRQLSTRHATQRLPHQLNRPQCHRHTVRQTARRPARFRRPVQARRRVGIPDQRRAEYRRAEYRPAEHQVVGHLRHCVVRHEAHRHPVPHDQLPRELVVGERVVQGRAVEEYARLVASWSFPHPVPSSSAHPLSLPRTKVSHRFGRAF